MKPAPPPPWPDGPALHRAYLRVLERVLADEGIAVDMTATGSAEFLDLQGLMSVLAQVHQGPAWPGLGLRVGASTGLSLHGRLGYAMAVSHDLDQALTLLCRYAPLRAPLLRICRDDSEAGWTRLNIDLSRVPAPAQQFFGEALLVIIEQAMRSLSTQALFAASHVVPWPSPPWQAQYVAHIQGMIEHNAACLSMAFPAQLLQTGCLGADREACELACQECERLLPQGEPDPRALIISQLDRWQGPWPDATVMAGRLGMSRRSLFRQLSSHGSSYRQLLDSLRLERACAALRHSNAAVEQIAGELGYADSSNFSRCFRRWTGMTPSQWRNVQRGRRESDNVSS